MAKGTRSGNTRDYTCIEGFSGPGGMSLGLTQAGFRLLAAFDFDEMAVATHNHNLGGHCFQARAEEISGESLLEQLSLAKGELDLFAGGPPCQGFSKQKRGAHNGDERNQLVIEYARLVHELLPRFFILENVAMFGQKRGREFLTKIATLLDDYFLYDHFYNTADYGLAQTRVRYVVVGKRGDIKAKFRIPSPSVKTWRTVGEVLDKLPEPPTDYTEHPDFPNHQRARVTDINIKRFSFVPQGGGWQDIPPEYRLACHQNVDVKSGGWPDVYGRLTWDGQCPTITGGFDSFTRGRYGHPLSDRPLTPREAARLQGFPDDYVFMGTRGDIRSQIGNAVPPPLAKAIGSEVKASLLIEDGLIVDEACDSTAMKQQMMLGFGT